MTTMSSASSGGSMGGTKGCQCQVRSLANGADLTFRLGPKLYTVNIDFSSIACVLKTQIFAGNGIIAFYDVGNNHALILILNS